MPRRLVSRRLFLSCLDPLASAPPPPCCPRRLKSPERSRTLPNVMPEDEGAGGEVLTVLRLMVVPLEWALARLRELAGAKSELESGVDRSSTSMASRGNAVGWGGLEDGGCELLLLLPEGAFKAVGEGRGWDVAGRCWRDELLPISSVAAGD